MGKPDNIDLEFPDPFEGIESEEDLERAAKRASSAARWFVGEPVAKPDNEQSAVAEGMNNPENRKNQEVIAYTEAALKKIKAWIDKKDEPKILSGSWDITVDSELRRIGVILKKTPPHVERNRARSETVKQYMDIRDTLWQLLKDEIIVRETSTSELVSNIFDMIDILKGQTGLAEGAD